MRHTVSQMSPCQNRVNGHPDPEGQRERGSGELGVPGQGAVLPALGPDLLAPSVSPLGAWRWLCPAHVRLDWRWDSWNREL